jgi:acetylornithine aminotransferase
MTHLMNTYARLPITFVRGEGVWLYDDQDQRYLDAISGIGVCSLGHAHPEIAEAIADQAKTLIHTANLAQIPWQEQLGDKLAAVSGMEKSFIGNSGAEAVECALKISRLYAHNRGIKNPKVLVTEKSFHGRTIAALSASGSPKTRAGFEPYVEGFIRVPYGDAEAAAEALKQHDDIVAVMLETIQGEGGISVPPEGYLGQLRALCDQHEALLILDEIQSGVCRTGYWYAYQHDNILPDIVTSAKALGNGIPIAACLARGVAAETFAPGNHGSTYGGNPLACRTACTVLDIMERDGINQATQERGAWMQAAFRQALADIPGVVSIRGRGLMLGIELDRPATAIRQLALDEGILLNVTANNVIRMLPPLIIDQQQAQMIVDGVVKAIGKFYSEA